MITEHSGRIIDTAGDGILAEFGSVVNAVECAVCIQSVMAKRTAGVEQSRRMEYRIGINVGDVIHDETRVYGDGINVAARLEGLAEPGGICISGKVYDEILGKNEFVYQFLGERNLKNIGKPVRVYGIRSAKGFAMPIAHAVASSAGAYKPSLAVLPFDTLGAARSRRVRGRSDGGHYHGPLAVAVDLGHRAQHHVHVQGTCQRYPQGGQRSWSNMCSKAACERATTDCA